MTSKEMLQKKVAVIVVDVQNDYIHEEGAMGKWGSGIKNIQKMLPRMKVFLDAMREKKIPVVHIQMTEDEHEIARNVRDKRMDAFGVPEEWSMAKSGTWGHELVFKPEAGEKVFQKNTYDIFSNPKLKEYLDSIGVETLIVLGGYTHACVDTSVRSAFTQGYDVVLATDLVVAPDESQDLHEASLKVLTLQFAYGATSEDILGLVEGGN